MFNPNISQTMEMQATAAAPGRNLERFITATGKTEKEYQAWASQVGRQMHINTLDRLICAQMGVYTVAHLAYLPTPLPDGIDNAEQETSYLLAHSRNPLELAQLWQSARVEAEMYLSVETVLATYLRPFPKENFERWGDRNHLPDVSKSWFKATGLELDVQIDEINEVAPIKVSIEEAVAFVRSWKPGGYVSPAAWLLAQIEERFQTLTTFKIKGYYAEHLLRSSLINHPAFTETVPF